MRDARLIPLIDRCYGAKWAFSRNRFVQSELYLTDRNVLTRELMIVPESTLSLFQREFLTGDIVKRSLANIESAVVIESKSEVRLEHVMSKQKVEEWVPYDLLKGAMVLEARDRVIYDEWVGTVEEVSLSHNHLRTS